MLEKLLVLQPNNPGTNHYYIHVMEPSPFADKALACAERLGKLTPGLSHTVHMPSHIYLRTGYYEKGVAVNESAIKSYQRTIPLYAPVTGADFLYSIHNLHMQTDNAMLAGRSVYAITSAFSTRSSVPKDYLFVPGAFGNYAQYIYMTPVFAYVRFGKWNELLQESAPEQSLVYANALYHFGRGMAFAGKRQMAEARKELEQLQSLMKDSSLLAPMNPFSPAIDGALVAEQLLAGSIALGEKKYDAAIDNFKTAVTLEGNMVYNEPRDWLLSPKQYLGNALLQAGKNAEARKVLEQDLAYNKENGWSLYGCWLSLKENDRPAADRIMDRYKAAFHTADVKIFAPVY